MNFARDIFAVLNGKKSVEEVSQKISGEQALISTAAVRATTISVELGGVRIYIDCLEEIDKRIKAEFEKEGKDGIRKFYQGRLYCEAIKSKEDLLRIVTNVQRKG